MIILYILAAIGALFVLGLIITIPLANWIDKQHEDEESKLRKLHKT